jgi:hypothetical protein
MDFISQLWLPIILSAVAVFIVSSILHMVIPLHKNDYKQVNNEDAVLDAFRTNNVSQGAYMFPWCHNLKDTGSEEYKAKIAKGPVGMLTILPPGGFNMGKSLAQWFVFLLAVSFFTAYIASHSLAAGADYLQAFQITGATAFMAYALGQAHESIWKGVSWTVTAKFMIDGLIYALVTAGFFGWMWPAAQQALPGGAG